METENQVIEPTQPQESAPQETQATEVSARDRFVNENVHEGDENNVKILQKAGVIRVPPEQQTEVDPSAGVPGQEEPQAVQTQDARADETQGESVLAEPDKQREEFIQKFNAFSKRDRELRKKEQDWKLKGKRVKELEEFEKKFKEDPYKALEDSGHSYENWTRQILEGEENPQKTEIEKLRSEVTELRGSINQKSEAENATRMQKIVSNKLNQINSFIKTNVQKFPFVNFQKDGELVWNIIEEKYLQDLNNFGEEHAATNLLSEEDACQLAENALRDEWKHKKEEFQAMQSVLSSEDFKFLPGNGVPVPNANQSKEKVKPKVMPQGTQTLTNSQQTRVPAKEPVKFTNERDRLQHAASFLRHSD